MNNANDYSQQQDDAAGADQEPSADPNEVHRYGFEPSNNLLGGVFLTYQIGLGEFGGIEDYGEVNAMYVQILFVLASMFISIIMLNLFIAIVSQAFEDVTQMGVQASYREKAGMIAENDYLVSADLKKEWCKKG